jgi:hypothetical protein
MAFRLGSQELVDEILTKQDEDPELQGRLKKLSIRLLLVGTDAPGGNDWQYAITLQKGKFVSVEVETKPAPSELRELSLNKELFDFKAIGDHRTLFDLVTGKIDLLEAMQKVKLVGDAGSLVTQYEGITRLLEFLASMGLEP